MPRTLPALVTACGPTVRDDGGVRVFAAIVPSEPARAHLEAFLVPRRVGEPVLRWTPPHLWHVTLAFMAEVPGDGLDDVVHAITREATASAPLHLRLFGAGFFPDTHEARVAWLGLGADAPGALDDLTGLALRTRRACSAAGAPTAGGPYTPHLTLARSRHPVDATPWLATLGDYVGPAWCAHEVTVFVSREQRGGRPHYVAEHSCPLGGGNSMAP